MAHRARQRLRSRPGPRARMVQHRAGPRRGYGARKSGPVSRHGGACRADPPYGAREITTGIGILSQDDPTPWLWGRVGRRRARSGTLAAGLGSSNPPEAERRPGDCGGGRRHGAGLDLRPGARHERIRANGRDAFETTAPGAACRARRLRCEGSRATFRCRGTCACPNRCARIRLGDRCKAGLAPQPAPTAPPETAQSMPIRLFTSVAFCMHPSSSPASPSRVLRRWPQLTGKPAWNQRDNRGSSRCAAPPRRPGFRPRRARVTGSMLPIPLCDMLHFLLR